MANATNPRANGTTKPRLKFPSLQLAAPALDLVPGTIDLGAIEDLARERVGAAPAPAPVPTKGPTIEPVPDFLRRADGSVAPIHPVERASVSVRLDPPQGEFRLVLESEQPRGWSLFQFEDPTRGALELRGAERSDGRKVPTGPLLWTTDHDLKGRARRMVHFLDQDGTGRYELIYADGPAALAIAIAMGAPPPPPPAAPRRSSPERPERWTWHDLDEADLLPASGSATRGLSARSNLGPRERASGPPL